MFRHPFSRRPPPRTDSSVRLPRNRGRRLSGAVAVLVLSAAAAGLMGCGGTPTAPDPPPPPLADPIDRALVRAVDYLAARQDEDGAWRSDFYGPLKDGPSLTSLVVDVLPLAMLPQATAQ